MKIYKFWLRFHWTLFPGIQLTIFQHWFGWWLGAGQATSHYLNQWWLICWRIYASLGLNELRKIKNQFAFIINFQHWGGTGNWNPPCWKRRTCTVNIMAADALAMSRARSSAAMILTKSLLECSGLSSEGVNLTSGSHHHQLMYADVVTWQGIISQSESSFSFM